MINSISNRQRATLVGTLILLAYSMLTYSISKNIILGVITDTISGLAVIGIPLLMYPIFNTNKNRTINYIYFTSRMLEGILMIIGGFFIMMPSLASFRESLYINIHIYFFISGAFFFYVLFYRTQIVPRFISIWGMLATIILFIITILKLVEIKSTILDALLIPLILNELFLAFWLIIKGFEKD